jgi:hypothetical protein
MGAALGIIYFVGVLGSLVVQRHRAGLHTDGSDRDGHALPQSSVVPDVGRKDDGVANRPLPLACARTP